MSEGGETGSEFVHIKRHAHDRNVSPVTESNHPDLKTLTGPDRRVRGLGWTPIVVAVMTAIGMFALWPDPPPEIDPFLVGATNDVYRADVERVLDLPCSYNADEACVFVTFRLLEGPAAGGVANQEFPDIASTPDLEVGNGVVLNYLPEAPASFQFQFADRERRGLLVWLTLAFAAAVIGLGRIRGLAALGGLAISILILIGFIVPAIRSGSNPVLVATVGASAIALVSLYLAHGFTPLTHVALVGTAGALAITIVLSSLTTSAAQFSGFASEESLYLTLVDGIDVRGLLLAGIVLGALGALDDVTVTQASAVWELRRANADLTSNQLFAAGLRVGRDHIASTVNTLLLAYAGASIPLMILFALSAQPLGVIANSEVVATEIVRTLVGSIGLVAAVPITTWLAARMVVNLSETEIEHGH